MEPESNPYLIQLKKLIHDYIQGYQIKIYLFGSRATGKSYAASDVDIALLPLEPLPENFIVDLKEKIEESSIPYKVDLVDLSQADKELKNKIMIKAIEWKD